jgi:protein-S-isoprenylcysteine O-methyltransferase Ste14
VNNLNLKAWLGLIFLAIVMGLLTFVSAGTIHYWQAWVYLAIYFAASLLITLYLMKKDPALLERRMRGGPTAEKRKAEKVIMFFTSLAFIALIVVPGLDRRFGWSHIPLAVTILGNVLVVISWAVIFVVFRENSFTSAIIEVAADQKVISTGPYAVVRHPMYAGAFLLMLGTPLALGSYWGLLALVSMAPFLIWRLFDEEAFLSSNLPGYAEYCGRVRWRLVPGIF